MTFSKTVKYHAWNVTKNIIYPIMCVIVYQSLFGNKVFKANAVCEDTIKSYIDFNHALNVKTSIYFVFVGIVYLFLSFTEIVCKAAYRAYKDTKQKRDEDDRGKD
jgi:hypothetical protein